MNFEHGRKTTVKTEKGWIRGFRYRDVYHFYGVEYAQAQRFMPPEEIPAWEGVKEAVNYGFTCYPFRPDRIGNNLKNPHRFWPQSENCQNLNVWTKSIEKGVKKPVVVWFHGGGFYYGSALEQTAYDGFNLCEFGDVVVVTVNHRINVLGYLDLAPFSNRYSHSANAGNLDLIAALKWVHRNIENFGGDPDQVTIFGQSGGGVKVISVMNMPDSAGLYCRAMIMSGTMGKHLSDAGQDMTQSVKRMLKILNIEEQEIEKLEEVSHRELAEAYLKAHHELGGKGLPYIGPIKNQDYLGDPVVYGFSEQAKKTPMIVGSVFAEFFTLPASIQRYALTDEEMRAEVEAEFGSAKKDRLIDLFQQAFPEKKIIDLLTYDCGAARGAAKEFIQARTKAGCAETYNYFFTPVFGINEGQTALHSSDIPFIFHNTDKVPSSDLGSATTLLENEMSGRFIAFAKTGKPQLEKGIEWPACTAEKEATMVFDCSTAVKYDFDTELLEEMRKLKTFSFELS